MARRRLSPDASARRLIEEDVRAATLNRYKFDRCAVLCGAGRDGEGL
jgi:hypothetical protein